jgi:hypothetical protein
MYELNGIHKKLTLSIFKSGFKEPKAEKSLELDTLEKDYVFFCDYPLTEDPKVFSQGDTF